MNFLVNDVNGHPIIVRVNLGKNFGQNDDGSPKPIRQMFEVFYFHLKQISPCKVPNRHYFQRVLRFVGKLFGLKDNDRLMVNVDTYYSRALNTPDGVRRRFFISVPPGGDIDEDPVIRSHLELRQEVEIDFRHFSPKGLICLVG